MICDALSPTWIPLLALAFYNPGAKEASSEGHGTSSTGNLIASTLLFRDLDYPCPWLDAVTYFGKPSSAMSWLMLISFTETAHRGDVLGAPRRR